jgi:hypothetical protein
MGIPRVRRSFTTTAQGAPDWRPAFSDRRRPSRAGGSSPSIVTAADAPIHWLPGTRWWSRADRDRHRSTRALRRLRHGVGFGASMSTDRGHERSSRRSLETFSGPRTVGEWARRRCICHRADRGLDGRTGHSRHVLVRRVVDQPRIQTGLPRGCGRFVAQPTSQPAGAPGARRRPRGIDHVGSGSCRDRPGTVGHHSRGRPIMAPVSDHSDGFLTSDDGVVRLHTLEGQWSDHHTIASRRAVTVPDAHQRTAPPFCRVPL